MGEGPGAADGAGSYLGSGEDGDGCACSGGLDGIVGVGGGTCASWFRAAGLPAVVWATQDEKAHEPNEYSRIENMVKDAKVFFTLFSNTE